MYPIPIEYKRFGILNGTQAKTLTIFAEHNGVSLSELQSKSGRELNALCFELAKELQCSMSNGFVSENVGDLARAYKSLAYGGSI